MRWAVPCLKVLVLPWRLYLTGHRGFRNEVWHPLRSWSLVARLVYAFLQSISAGWGMRRRTAIVLRPWLAIGPDGCVVVNGCREPDAVNTRGAAMSEESKALVRRVVDEAWNQGKLEVVHEAFAPDYQEHNPGPEQEPGIEDFVERWGV